MDLQDILVNAIGGFIAGLTADLSMKLKKQEEWIELAEAIPEEHREKEGLTGEKLKNWKKNIRNVKIFSPIAVGGLYSLASYILSSFIQQDPSSIGDRWIVAVPFAYVGSFLGRGIRKIKKREKRKEIEAVKKAVQDSDNAEKYLLSEDKIKAIEEVFSEIEKIILNSESSERSSINNKIKEGPARKLYDFLTEDMKPYTPLLFKWSSNKLEKIIEHADLQRHITNFYREHEEKINEFSNAIHCMILGEPKEFKIKVFTKEGNDFYIQTIKWDNLKIIRDDKRKVIEVFGRKPSITSSEREIWTDDYRALTDRFIWERERKDGKRYSMMLVHASYGTPGEIKEEAIVSTFLKVSQDYNTKSSG